MLFVQEARGITQGHSLVWENQTAPFPHAPGIDEELYVIDRQ